MHTYLLTIAYDGGSFAGWQRQSGFDTVQERLEDAMACLCGEPVVVHGAGRTDAGVHAFAQAAHVRIFRDFEPSVLLRAINGHLPASVRVHAVRRAPPNFHARFSAVGKRYLYRCLVSRVLPVFGRGRFHWIRRPVDLGRMRRAAALLTGEHDFAAFASNPGYPRKFGTVRRIGQLRLVKRPHGFDIFVQGNGFLYNMVRTVSGTLIEVGLGRRDPAELTEILASKDRRRAGFNAPAEGLYLLRVLYPVGAWQSRESAGVRADLGVPSTSSRGTGPRLFQPQRANMNHHGQVAIEVSSRHGEVSPEMEEYAIDKAARLTRFNDQVSRIEIVVDGPNEAPEVEMVVHIDNHPHLVATDRGEQFRRAIDGLCAKMERQLRRAKEKLKNHKGEASPPVIGEDDSAEPESFDDAVRRDLES